MEYKFKDVVGGDDIDFEMKLLDDDDDEDGGMSVLHSANYAGGMSVLHSAGDDKGAT